MIRQQNEILDKKGEFQRTCIGHWLQALKLCNFIEDNKEGFVNKSFRNKFL